MNTRNMARRINIIGTICAIRSHSGRHSKPLAATMRLRAPHIHQRKRIERRGCGGTEGSLAQKAIKLATNTRTVPGKAKKTNRAPGHSLLPAADAAKARGARSWGKRIASPAPARRTIGTSIPRSAYLA
jgi:hypothetical protein